MTMGKWKLCVRWSACCGSPSSISLACFKQEEQTKLMCISFSNGNGSAFENSFDCGYLFARAWAMYKDTMLETWEEMRRDLVFGTTAQLNDLSMPWKGEFRLSPELSARPLAAADSEERQICTTCLFVQSVGLWKDDSLMLSPIVGHTSVWEGLVEEGRFDVASRSETPKPSCQSHKQQLLRPRSGPSKAAHTRKTRVKEQQVLSKYRKKEWN